jgi:predicted nucleic acid-binding Zn ribbon protein
VDDRNPVLQNDFMQYIRQPERIGKILTRLMARRGFQRQISQEQLETAWAEAVGETLARQTRLGSLRRGTLEVFIRHKIYEQELLFQQTELMNALNVALSEKKIKRLKFTLR